MAFSFNELTAIRLYTGDMPTDRNAAPTGTLLASFDQIVGEYSAQAIQWELFPSGGSIDVEAPASSVIPPVVGTVGYAMLYAPAEAIIHWVYCTVGLVGSGAELIFSSLDFESGISFTVRSGQATIPP